MVDVESIIWNSDEIEAVYWGDDLVWRKIRGIWFIGYTADESPYHVRLNGSSANTMINSGEIYRLEEVTSLKNMFYAIGASYDLVLLEGLSNWDVSRITNIEGLFHGCNDLESVGDLSNWDVSNVTSMASMFSSCFKLSSVGDLSNWNVSNVTSMAHMFYNSNLQLNISSWNVSNVTNMNDMFNNYNGEELDLSNWDVSNVTDMSRMFCISKLKSLNLSNWNFSKVTNFKDFFWNTSFLTTIIGPVSGIKTSIPLNSAPLTYESAMIFINGLETVSETQTITFIRNTYSTLSREDKAIANAKGWTVTSNWQ